MCMEKILCTPTFYSLLLQPKCFSISISNDPYILLILLSPALTSVLPYMHESSHMCSDILLSPALTCYVQGERSVRLELGGCD